MPFASLELAILGGTPAFLEPLHVGRPNLGNREHFLRRMEDMLDRRCFSNNGPFVREFEARIAEFIGVKHCVAMCNATIGLAIAIRAMDLQGEVLLPAYTFVSTAHVLQWQRIKPVFVDLDPVTHNICPKALERAISPRSAAVIGVHVWGRPCDTVNIARIAKSYDIPVLYDAAHAFGCSHQGRMIGTFGSCEVFSFHATKFLNSFEGGAVVTNDERLAERLRYMRNFGFTGYDCVLELGINGKMTEACAAMGVTSLEAINDLIAANRRNYQRYVHHLEQMPGVRLVAYDETERNNFQYIVAELDPEVFPLTRDELVDVLHYENVLARKYFWPGCHRMQPYATEQPDACTLLPQTERVAARVIVFPNGQSVGDEDIDKIAEIIRSATLAALQIKSRIRQLAEQGC